MKKYIAIALLMVLGTAYPAYARWSVGTAGGGVASAAGNSCTTSDDSALLTITETPTDASGSFAVESDRWWAQSFTVSCTGTFMLTEYETRCAKVTNANNGIVSLYTDSSGSLGSEVAGTDVTFAWSGISSSAGACLHTLSTPKSGLACNTQYWFVVRNDANSADGKFFIDTSGDYASGAIAENLTYPGEWDYSTRSGMDFRLVIMGCQE
jgi:hypothetical protein